MPQIIGIDLGTTNSCVATLEHGHPSVLSNAEGGRTTPSVVAFLDEGDRLVGAAARRQAVINPERTITSIKRFMGRKLDEVTDERRTVPYHLIAGANDAVRIVLAQEELSPEQISALILAKLKTDAEAYLGQVIDAAVITVPAYFNDAQRQATKDAAAIAGLEVLRLVNEPTAAALAYGFADEAERTVLVFDLGGGTFDVSVLDIGDGVFEVRATKGDNHLGGDDFDQAIVDWLVEGFRNDKGVDLTDDTGALQRLYEAAEKAKIELSSAPRTQISLPFITTSGSGPEHLERTLNRSELAQMVKPLLERCIAPVRQAVHDAELSMNDIDEVLLVGGMTRMPALQDLVRELTGKEPQRGVNPDEAVALGAAIQAGVLVGEVDDVLLLDVTPLSLGIETKGGIATRLIDANTTIPARVTETFTTAEDNQPSVEVHVVQGEREMAADNRSLGRLQLMGIPPAQAGVPQVEVTFDLDANGILQVAAVDLGTGETQETRIEASTGLGDYDIQRMKAEAEAFRESDRQARTLAERRNEAAALREQAERVLHRFFGRLSEAEQDNIEAAVAALDHAIASQESDLADLAEAQDALAAAVQAFSQRLYADEQEVIEPIVEDVDITDDQPDPAFASYVEDADVE
jgi:molecular chaperone DnaK